MRTLIVVPARYGSTRFPGKPLAEIAGRSMVLRVADAAKAAADIIGDAGFVVATDDARIKSHCEAEGVPVVMTPEDVATGTDRALAAVSALGVEPEVVINLQGDAPFTPPEMVAQVGRAALDFGDDAATPVVRLSWKALDDCASIKNSRHFQVRPVFAGRMGARSGSPKTLFQPCVRKKNCA